jgi:2-amino-4-hydroxy-6-hydroxymethyldihydropteridine diphosphokinase
LKKVLNKDLSLYFNSFYPYKSAIKSDKKHNIIIGIGGNIGDVKLRFNKLFLNLRTDSRFDIIQTSPLLKNPPFGYTNQDDFINAVIYLKTNLSPRYCLKAFQRYENRYKRERSFKDAPRTLDIDIIFYDNKSVNTNDLIIPHPHWNKRDSVVIPLGYII